MSYKRTIEVSKRTIEVGKRTKNSQKSKNECLKKVEKGVKIGEFYFLLSKK